jgi:hypothetical protein
VLRMLASASPLRLFKFFSIPLVAFLVPVL